MHYGLRVIMEDFAQRIPKGNLVRMGKAPVLCTRMAHLRSLALPLFTQNKRERGRETKIISNMGKIVINYFHFDIHWGGGP